MPRGKQTRIEIAPCFAIDDGHELPIELQNRGKRNPRLCLGRIRTSGVPDGGLLGAADQWASAKEMGAADRAFVQLTGCIRITPRRE